MSAPTTQPSARGRPRDPRRDEAILTAAIELAVEVGYDRMTVDALAARAGVSKPTIYRRWPGGKPELVVAALAARTEPRRALPATGSLRGDLLADVRALAADLHEQSRLAAGIATQMRTSPELAALIRDHVVEVERAHFRTLVERAVARGELPASDFSPLAADIAPALIHGRIVMSREPVDDAFVTELVDRILLPILTDP